MNEFSQFKNQEQLSKDIFQLFQNGIEFSDFKIIIKSKKETVIHAHKAILSSRSEYFYGLFRSKMKESQEGIVVFTDVSPEIFKLIIHYIYTGIIDINLNNAFEALISARKLLLDSGIINFLTMFIEENIQLENVIDILAISSRLNYQDLYFYCMKFVMVHFQEIIHSQRFLKFSANDLNFLLNQPNFEIENEIDLFYLLLKWVQFHSDSTSQSDVEMGEETNNTREAFSQFIGKIRFCDINPVDLQKIQKLKLIPNSIMHDILEFSHFIQNEPYSKRIYELKQKYHQQNFAIFQSRDCFSESSIIKGKKKYSQKLKNWIKKPEFFSSMILGYSAKKDGFCGKSFHQKCDNSGRSLVVIQTTNGSIFGGFTDVGWRRTTGNNFWIKDENAFIFTLRNIQKTEPQRFKLKKSKSKYSILYRDYHGPSFGGGDITIYSSSSNQEDLFDTFYSDFGYTYEVPSQIEDTLQKAKIFLAGSFDNWKIEEIEVYFEKQNF
ncbi:pep-cterm sorting domain-containing protein [Anaeramoeba ignava]|uniref:Pep-cterm sorting domain-containing protein n=1 Tax=Anaeramoeba ignava TaxID=1746090 RepID=A0A9Q0RCM5_ANAIG|nr:pep-cterm sorting domain-containing protein [Anaeramoeba ignava]